MTILNLALAAVFFWAGFRAAPHPRQHQSKLAFFLFLLLAGFTGYFDWREYRSLGELAAIIEPIPDVTDVDYIPTGAELTAIAAFVEAVPVQGRLSDATGREGLTERAREIRSRYWSLATTMSVEEVAAFYRVPANRAGWELVVDEPPYLRFERGDELLTVFVQSDWTETKVWYMYGVGP